MAASQWNASIPAMGNQISDDIPDIEENFTEIQRILETITDGTLGTTDTANYLLNDGLRSVPSTETVLFYKDTAVTGYTLENTLDDKLVFVSKGSVAGGETGGGAHVNRSNPGSDRFDNGIHTDKTAVSYIVQRLVHNQNGVIHHGADEDNKAQHGHDIQCLGCNQPVYQPQTDQTSGCGKRNGKHNDERIKEIFKQGGHQQIHDDRCQKKVPLHRRDSLGKLVRISTDCYRYVF